MGTKAKEHRRKVKNRNLNIKIAQKKKNDYIKNVIMQQIDKEKNDGLYENSDKEIISTDNNMSRVIPSKTSLINDKPNI